MRARVHAELIARDQACAACMTAIGFTHSLIFLEIVCAFVAGKYSGVIAAQIVSTERAAASCNRCLSLAKIYSIKFRSGEYLGGQKSLASAMRINWRTALALRLPDLSKMTVRVQVLMRSLDEDQTL